MDDTTLQTLDNTYHRTTSKFDNKWHPSCSLTRSTGTPTGATSIVAPDSMQSGRTFFDVFSWCLILFRLLCTIVGMCTVDMHRLYRHHELKENHNTLKEVDVLTVINLSDLLCGNIRQWQYHSKRRAVAEGLAELPLCRITDEQGNTVRQPTTKQLAMGKNVGNPIVLRCFVFRRYKLQGETQQQTAWWCRKCCLEEHQQSDDHCSWMLQEPHSGIQFSQTSDR